MSVQRTLLVLIGVAGLASAAPGTVAAGVPECFGQPATITGTPGDDPDLDGTSGDDVIVGLGGNDLIDGLGGNDRICGGPSGPSGHPVSIHGEILSGGAGNDRVAGGAGPDGISGGSGGSLDDDRFDGGGGRDLVYYNDASGIVIADLADGTATGGGGEDALADIEDLNGSTGYPDDLRGDAGPNWLQGFHDVDLIYGRGGDDVLRGWLGADELRGGPDDDTLWGGWGGATDDDDLFGGGGDDDLRPDADLEINPVSFGTGNDEVDGGGGRDLLSIEKAVDSVAVDLLAGTLTGQGSDDIAAVEDVTGGDDHDDLAGDDGPNTILGGPGSDVAAGIGGDDEIDLGEDGGAGSGGDGDDRIVGGNGGGGDGNDTLIGTSGANGLGGGAGRDVIRAKAGNDTIESPVDPAVSAGTDLIVAGAGFDTVYPARGSDTVRGGSDADTLIYGGSLPSAIEVDLAAGTTTGAVEQDVPGFEHVHGTGFDDVLLGTEGVNELRGLTGDDDLFGREGDDTLLGFFGADDMFGGGGIDQCDYIAEEGDTIDSCDPF